MELLRNVCFLLFMICTAVAFTGCDKDDEKGSSEKGWIKHGGKTYGLTRAAAVSQVESFPGFTGKGYTVRVINNDLTNDIMFGFYSNASSLKDVSGTFTMYQGQPKDCTMSNIVTSGTLNGEPFYWPGELTNVSIKISYSDGKYKIEGTWYRSGGNNVDIYYNGDISIQ